MRKTILDPYQELANGIVVQAAQDWRAAVKKLKKHPDRAESRREKEECEQFFLSEWFVLLTEVDGRGILQKLKQEAGIYDE